MVGNSYLGISSCLALIRELSLQLAPIVEKIQHCARLTFGISNRHVRKTNDREVLLRKAGHIGRTVCIST